MATGLRRDRQRRDGGRGSGRGTACLVEAATRPDADIVINGIVGAAGLEATLAALCAGKRVALANKESLVMAASWSPGPRARAAARSCRWTRSTARCCSASPGADRRRREPHADCVGRPVPHLDAERVADATIEAALQHPTWRMGRKITVDSATLVNKALEVIEAHYLFGVEYDQVGSWCIRSRSCTRWSSSWTDRCWPKSDFQRWRYRFCTR